MKVTVVRSRPRGLRASTDDDEAAEHFVGATRHAIEVDAGLGGVAGLAQHLAVEDDVGVAGDHQVGLERGIAEQYVLVVEGTRT